MSNRNQMNNKNKIWIIISILIAYIIISTIYIKYYYNNIDLNSIIEYIVITTNFILVNLYNLFNKVLNLLMDKEIFRLVFIVMSIIVVVQYNKVIDKLFNIIKLIKRVNLNGIELQMEALKEDLENQSAVVEGMNEESSKYTPEDMEKEKIKEEVLQTMVDSPAIVEFIDKVLNSNSKAFRIPLNLVPSRYKFSDIKKIFNTEVTGSSVKIISIREDRADIVIEVFAELLEKGIIYSQFDI
ncbi:hypothetical protein [uncultured Clostridium sp.]|uniref:hypothetical protein n=1 Tax=uncultured Clostridium sp. TaxID=59620 RepID=UPI0027DD4397|nr:hypothetical protein [uncultured Clostridium sp.]